MEVVIVPAWRRPDFLHATLARLAIAAAAYPDPDPPLVWVTLDRAHTPEVAETAAAAAPLFRNFRLTRRLYHRYKGNSYNLLAAYGEALAERPTRVHLVEEDVLVAADYFTCVAAMSRLAPEAFATSACRNQNIPLGVDPPADPAAIYLHPTYQSLAVSFTPARLGMVLPHACREYLADPVGYCKTAFPATRIPAGNAEQDGLIGRVLEAAGGRVAYPAVPRAYHAGFHGYNRRGRRLHGPIPDRARQILSMTAAELNACAGSYPDHTTCPLDPPADRPHPGYLLEWPP